jgi:phosphoribosylformylglycinamidine (FGAM) synthase-like enzyme
LRGGYVSASAIAEGGLLLRLFEGAFGSGLGARVDFRNISVSRRDGLLFGEFIGACLLEVSPEFEIPKSANSIPHLELGTVTAEARLTLAEGNTIVWEEEVTNLAERWSETFREVLK